MPGRQAYARHQERARIKEEGGALSVPWWVPSWSPVACSGEDLGGPLQPLRPPGLLTAFTAEDSCASCQTPVASFTKDIVFAMGITNSHCYHRPPREGDAAPSFQKDLLSWPPLDQDCLLPPQPPANPRPPAALGAWVHAPEAPEPSSFCEYLHSRALFNICATGART